MLGLAWRQKWSARPKRDCERDRELQPDKNSTRKPVARGAAQSLRLANEARRRQIEEERGAKPPEGLHRWTKADQRFEASVHAARIRHPDFNQVISTDYNPTPQIRRLVFKSPVAGELAYWLAKNPQEYQRISALAKGPAMREIRKLEAKVKDQN